MARDISVPTLLVGIGAGLATGLLFAALVGGSVLAMPLFLMAPLPLAIAALGWGTASGLIAGVVAIAAMAIGLSWPAAVAVTLADVAPTLIACHLLGLARPVDATDPSAPPEWYPIGRVAVAVIATVSAAVVLGGYAIGFDPIETTNQVVAAYRQMLTETKGPSAQMPDVAQLEPFVRGTVRLMPAFFPASWVLVIVFDLWLAVRIVRKSGRLARPAEDLAAFELPVAAGVVFAAAFAAAFLAGPIGLIASVIAGSLFAGHFLVGLGVIHTLTRGTDMRIIIMAVIYGLVLLFTLPAAAIALIGLAEPHLGLKRRMARRRSP